MNASRYATVLILCTLVAGGQRLQQSTRRAIDRCAQDGLYFYALNDDPAKPVQVESDGISIQIEHPDSKNETDAVLTFSRGQHTLVQKQKDFEAAQGWLTVSNTGAFATTWNENASSASTQLFSLSADGNIVENTSLIPNVEHIFQQDAKTACKSPGANTTAIKWIDNDHLLIAINAWASGFCYSNFTEGFLLNVTANHIDKKLPERELINLPAVCTWNLVPVRKH